MSFLYDLKAVFKENANSEFAISMKTYMKNNFEFYGIKTDLRRSLLKPLIETHRLEIRDTIRTLAFDLYDEPQREMHHCVTELFEKQLRKTYKKEDIYLIEKLITKNSWWDTVDFIAKQIVGKYLQTFPEETPKIVDRFSSSNNMWLQRTSIIFQLGYREATNKDILFKQCLIHRKSDEFFIQKAIGWALREYGRYNPQAVLEFVASSDLKPLSKREAIRKLI